MKQYIPAKENLSDRVAVAIEKSLEDGELSGQVYLPSSRELAGRYETSLPTMQKALRKLQDKNIIRLQSRRRGFIRTDRSAINNKRTSVRQIAVLSSKHPDSEKNMSDWGGIKDSWFGVIIESMMQHLARDNYHCIPIY